MVTRRFDVFRNSNAASAKHVPYLLVVQSEFLEELPTRVVVPLTKMAALKRKPAAQLNPEFEIESVTVAMLTQQVGAIATHQLKKLVANLESERAIIVRALDFLFSGI
ncbi:MAG TPA: CcdB family protein [Rudaea sp.]|jgi:toxin CcdB|nr:CcdB family protein [Rudaea sp.]